MNIENKFYNHMGGKENVDKNVYNLNILGKFEYPENPEYDFIFGTFEIKGFLGYKKYLFIDGGDFQNYTHFELDEFSIPTIELNKYNEKTIIDRDIPIFKNLGIKIIPEMILKLQEAKELIEKNNDISFSKITKPKLHYYNYINIIKFGYELSNIEIFFKNTGEFKIFTLEQLDLYK